MQGYQRITKANFYASGGFSNPQLARTMVGTRWAYWIRIQR